MAYKAVGKGISFIKDKVTPTKSVGGGISSITEKVTKPSVGGALKDALTKQVVDKTEKDQYSTIRDASGNLTDYGKSLERQNVNYSGQSTPSGYNYTPNSYYGGLTPTYEMYAGNAQAKGLAFADRATWEADMARKGTAYMSGTGGTAGTLVAGGTTTGTGTGTGAGTNQQGLISQAKTTASNAIAEALKAKLAAIPQTYDPLRATSEVQKAQDLRSILEQNANVGDVGGVGRQATLETQTAGEQRLGQYNIAQQQDINTAQAQAAQAQADVETSALNQALAEQARIDSMNQSAAQFAANKAQSDYQYQTSIAEQKAQREAEAKATAEALRYKQEQDAIANEQAQAETDYNRAKYDEEFAYKQYLDAKNFGLKEKNYALNVKKAQRAYETAKARTAIALKNANKKKGGGTTDKSGPDLSVFGIVK